MLQIFQNFRTGETELVDIPAPGVEPGQLLIRTRRSLISLGTERMLVEFGRAGWLEKARRQPEKVRQVLEKVKTDGLFPTLEAVRSKLDQPMPLGYCNVGEILAIGVGVDRFQVGDRVVSNGAHAEVVRVPQNLCAKVPDDVDDDTAAFTVLGAIALQGIRLADPTLGEHVVVIGLGMVGLLTAQLLQADGCHVLGTDLDPSKIEIAKSYGIETVNLAAGEYPLAKAEQFSRGRGVDAVIIAASTKSNQLVHQAAQMCRKKGRIVMIGVAGIELQRSDFYEKELSFQVSSSYGPGRHDVEYEERGHDYPLGYVRWTEQRNFEAVLDMMALGKVSSSALVTHRYPLREAAQAYGLIGGAEPVLGILLTYGQPVDAVASRTIFLETQSRAPRATGSSPVIGMIGAGNFAARILIPAFRKAGARMGIIASSTGISGAHTGRKYGFAKATSDNQAIIEDPEVNAVIIATRHDSHASLVTQSLTAAKHVFVEKPLALNADQLRDIAAAYANVADSPEAPILMVGFNRRFAPHVQKIKSLLASVSTPKSFIMTVNAGEIPPDHWTQQRDVGGGRIIGEACHFIDLLRFLAGAPISGVQATMIGNAGNSSAREDKVSITLSFADGSMGTVHYLANGHRSFPKERLEVFSQGRILQLNNFRQMRGYGWPGFVKMNLRRQDKGHFVMAARFLEAIQQGLPAPIPFSELEEVTRISFEVVDQLWR